MNDRRTQANHLHRQRQQDARAKIAFYTGATDAHPHGWSGLRKLFLPPEDDRRCRFNIDDWDAMGGRR